MNFPWDLPRWDLFIRCVCTPVKSKPFPAGYCWMYQRNPKCKSRPRCYKHMCSKCQTPILPVPVANVTLQIPINPDALQQALIGYDQTEARFLVGGFRKGFKINYHGTPPIRFSENHPSISHHKDIVKRKLSKELQMGRLAGPFVSHFIIINHSNLVWYPRKNQTNSELSNISHIQREALLMNGTL